MAAINAGFRVYGCFPTWENSLSYENGREMPLERSCNHSWSAVRLVRLSDPASSNLCNVTSVQNH